MSDAGYIARREGIDLMVAMNPQTFKEDLAEVVPGGWLLYDFDPASRLAARRHQRARHPHRSSYARRSGATRANASSSRTWSTSEP